MEKRKVLILNTSHNDLDMILALKKMNQYVIAVGNRKGLVGEEYVDEYICMDYSDKEKVLCLAREKNIDGICSCCNDFGVVTASYVAEKMGLKGHDTVENVEIIHNKGKFKKFAKKIGLITPNAEEFSDETSAIKYLETISFPSIVKPVDLSAGNGISQINNVEEGKRAIRYAFEKSREKKIIIEPFLEGSQHAICTFLKDQKVISFTSNNEYSIVNPYRVEVDTFPAKHIDEVKDVLIGQIEKIAETLNLVDGIFHVQYMLVDGKPYILEAMRRTLGNMYGIPAKMAGGFDWDYWEARTHVGLPIDDVPHIMETKKFAAYRAIMACDNGILKEIELLDELNWYIKKKFMLKGPGDLVKDNMSEPIGFLFMEFESEKQMEDVMVGKYDYVRTRMER